MVLGSQSAYGNNVPGLAFGLWHSESGGIVLPTLAWNGNKSVIRIQSWAGGVDSI